MAKLGYLPQMEDEQKELQALRLAVRTVPPGGTCSEKDF